MLTGMNEAQLLRGIAIVIPVRVPPMGSCERRGVRTAGSVLQRGRLS